MVWSVGRRPGRWCRSVVALWGLVVVTLLAVAAPASAHAVLEGSTPQPDVVLATAPHAVSLTFDESVTLLATSLRVYGPGGDRVDAGDVAHAGGRAQDVTVHLRATREQGTYLVSWRVISADSHPVSGAYTFSVGRTSAAPSAPKDTTDEAVGVTLGAARLVGYLGSALLVGTMLFVAWCWPEGWPHRRVRRLAALGAGLLVLGTVADVLLKGPYDAALGLGSIGQGRLLREVLGTTYGHAAIARLVLVAALVAVLASGLVAASTVASAAPRRGRPPRAAITAAALLLGVTFALSGHAAAGSGRAPALVNDTLHVVCASAWLGGLVVILAVVLPLAGDAAAVVGRFSGLAAGLVLVIVASGLYQAIRQVDAWAALTGTTYGRELLVKIAIVLGVLAAAGGSRAWVRRQAQHTPAPPAGAATTVLRRTVLAETVGLVAVLAVSSALVATEPARTAYHPATAASLTIEGDTVQVSAMATGDRQVELQLSVLGPDRRPTEPKEIDAAVSLPSRSIGPLPVTLAVAGPGRRRGTVAVPVAGTWQLAITVRTSAVDQATRTLSLPVR